MLDHARAEIRSGHICDVLGSKVRNCRAEPRARVRKPRVELDYLAGTEADRSGASGFYPNVCQLPPNQARRGVILRYRSAKVWSEQTASRRVFGVDRNRRDEFY